jgi:hypothetical protein
MQDKPNRIAFIHLGPVIPAYTGRAISQAARLYQFSEMLTHLGITTRAHEAQATI